MHDFHWHCLCLFIPSLFFSCFISFPFSHHYTRALSLSGRALCVVLFPFFFLTSSGPTVSSCRDTRSSRRELILQRLPWALHVQSTTKRPLRLQGKPFTHSCRFYMHVHLASHDLLCSLRFSLPRLFSTLVLWCESTRSSGSYFRV